MVDDPRLNVQSGPFKGRPQQWFTRAEVLALLGAPGPCEHLRPVWCGDTPNGPQFWCRACGAFQASHGQWRHPSGVREGGK